MTPPCIMKTYPPTEVFVRIRAPIGTGSTGVPGSRYFVGRIPAGARYPTRGPKLPAINIEEWKLRGGLPLLSFRLLTMVRTSSFHKRATVAALSPATAAPRPVPIGGDVNTGLDLSEDESVLDVGSSSTVSTPEPLASDSAAAVPNNPAIAPILNASAIDKPKGGVYDYLSRTDADGLIIFLQLLQNGLEVF